MNRVSYFKSTVNVLIPSGNFYVVYKIHIGSKVYIGSTKSLKTRISSHKCALNKIAEQQKNILKGHYSKFDYNDIINYGYYFTIVGTTPLLDECIEMEKNAIREYPNDKLLNINIAARSVERETTGRRGRKPALPREKKLPVTIWVKSKHVIKAKKDCMMVQLKYEAI